MKRNLIAIPIPSSTILELVQRHMNTVDTLTGSSLHCFRRVEPLPDDIIVARSYYDPEIDCFMLVLEHPTFPEYIPGHVLRRIGIQPKEESDG
jgi:hypothetical protein